ncbi:MAG: hypothetical protein MJY79_04815 [Bacteroidaceae bacterium]|nr:hypothetical protein [Bacteroidaceae bacterium]
MKAATVLTAIAAMLTASASMTSCKKPDTTYRVDYLFDNTYMESDFLNVYDNYKWRSSHHKLDTIYVDSMRYEYASGYVEDYVKNDVPYLVVDVMGYREHGGVFKLDTVFHITPGEYNHFMITPEMIWLDSVGDTVPTRKSRP